jgi:hypothetical protein
LIEWSEIIRIDEPLIPKTNSITSEGTGIIGATNANNRGLKGTGIKVGVIDIGFQEYTSLLGTELPASVTTKVMGTYTDFTSNIHGTACAEIVHDVAPEATLFLVNVDDIDVDFHNAVYWLQSQGVSVISSSIGINLKMYIEYLYVGLNVSTTYAFTQIQNLDRIKSQWDNTINSAISGGGVTWAQSAGNEGQKRWVGSFTDSDGDYYLNFTSSQNYNEIDVSTAEYGDELYVLMSWGMDTNYSTTDDFDLIVTDWKGAEVCSSRIYQPISLLGMEVCRFTVDPAKRYAVYVYKYRAMPQDIFLVLGHDKFPNFKINNPVGTVTLGSPAHNSNVITVGAIRYNTPNIIEPYSSQGPNADGIIKPDLVAPDCVSTASYGSSAFCGTSAAAPHVAGLSALVKQAYPTWSPSQIKSYLEVNALDLGASGKDNVFGSGLVQLPLSLYETCTYTISPGSDSFASINAQGVVNVTSSSSSCSWTAVSNASWITVTSGVSGSGNGIVGYSVATNNGFARTGTITIDGQTFTISQASANANAYFDTVQKTYIGYYQRAADPEGLIYWAGRLDSVGGNFSEMIEAFANSAEAQALYGTINSGNISTVVNGIYNALFGRDAEAEGLNYYVSGFNLGQFTPATIMLNVLYGAQNEDLQSVNNKLSAANFFTRTIDPELDGTNFQVTYAGDGDAIAGRNFLALYATSVKVPTQAETTAYIQANISNPGDALPATYSMSGTIHSGSNSCPVLSGATVSIAGKSTTTSSIGTFFISGIAAGTYALSVSKAGYDTYTDPAYYVGSNQTGLNIYITVVNSPLVCVPWTSFSVNGIQFYGNTSYYLSNTAANAAVTATLTWGANYQNIYNLPAYNYSGSLRAQLWAVPYSFSGGTLTNVYGLGVFSPNFMGYGAYSLNQLYVGSYSTMPQSSSVSILNPPVGTYCIVATIDEYNPGGCSDLDDYCYDQWIQFSAPVMFR